MSLVAYDSSDDNSEDEEVSSTEVTKSNDKNKCEIIRASQSIDENLRFQLQENKCQDSKTVQNDDKSNSDGFVPKVNFSVLPKPKSVEIDEKNIVEEGDIPPKKENELQVEKSAKRNRGPVKITVPPISDFKDLDEENKKKLSKNKFAEKSSGLFDILPPPKGENSVKKPLVPQVVTKVTLASNVANNIQKKFTNTSNIKTVSAQNEMATKVSLNVSHYDSNSEDEDDTNISNSEKSGVDFLGLNSNKLADWETCNTSSLQEEGGSSEIKEPQMHNYTSDQTSVEMMVTEENSQNSNKTLVSNIMNLPKEEILLKNKAEVGPKLPIPEQEYNVDAEGNVAFDDKAIEYLCGRRGIKRKNKEVDEASIIEIKGDDIKPDEREWLVKALTEEPIHRPLSMQTSGVSSQSKKKHQITYLAHQAKAMEVELKNQWALNRATRKQTQSKYGF